ncbi:MAG: amino acid racemase [Mucispirillum sp.]|uniref:Amino acid racemase n=1 Tax=Candidatus Mucispirillum faecigallinarum TaxID=2838699 RepID=A0A9D2GUW3_9BACT|nr:amino acid racemase [Mucispirillum sp.]HIZ90483.1 amino acid racemase [Candidatus Mucispirillum faecigallinarum]
MKTLGIIGGMGPAATIDLYKKIVEQTPAEKDQDHIHVIIDSYPQIEDRTSYILHGGKSPAPKLIESAKRLEAAGADALIMPCNTAHYFAKDIEKAVYIPLIHIVKCSAEAIKKKYPYVRKIGLIATTGTIKAGVYGDILKNYDLETITLNEELENNIMDCIYKGVKAGKTEEYSTLFQKCVDDIASLGAELLIAGCTEIPLLMPYIKTNLPVIDATYELASAAVKYALNK